METVALDRENAFLLYATFAGDLVRTAAACGVRPADILKAADEGNWQERLKPIIELSRSTKPGDMERGINRAVNFVQAHRARMFLERVLARVCAMTPDELDEYILTGTLKDGSTVAKLSTRALADLASALEKVHALSYQALGDTAPERTKRAETGPSASVGDLHVKLAQAMADARKAEGVRGQLLDMQLVQAQAIADKPAPSPHDDDDH